VIISLWRGAITELLAAVKADRHKRNRTRAMRKRKGLNN
jgi:hypothetical protein